MSNRRSAGFSTIEVLATLASVAVLAGATVPNVLAALDRYRASGAARYVAARLTEARMDAIVRGAHTAVRFSRVDGGFSYATFVDGNRNGILARDIENRIDREIRPGHRLASHFSGVDFGVMPGLPPVEAGDSLPGDDPVRLGTSNSVTFSPFGTATPGSLYILGPRNEQFVVRILGETGRIRVLRFDRHRRQWTTE
jgi:type II secretory pathway pseudopilin PulG